MSEQIKQIAMRIKDLREISGLSVDEAAKQCGVDRDTYISYESGETEDIPIGFLYEAANLYKTELTAVLTGDDPRLKVYSLVRAGRGVHVERRAEYKYSHLAYNFIGRKMEPLHVVIEPDDPDAPIALNYHPGHEFDYVLEGEMLLQLQDKVFHLYKGDAFYFDSGYPHGMKAINGTCSFLACVL